MRLVLHLFPVTGQGIVTLVDTELVVGIRLQRYRLVISLSVNTLAVILAVESAFVDVLESSTIGSNGAEDITILVLEEGYIASDDVHVTALLTQGDGFVRDLLCVCGDPAREGLNVATMDEMLILFHNKSGCLYTSRFL